MNRFYDPLNNGSVFKSISNARKSSPKTGDVVLLRDFDRVAPTGVWTKEKARGKWHLRPYSLSDGQCGKLLMLDDRAINDPSSVVPPEFDIKVDLPGWYSIWIGVPLESEYPKIAAVQFGIDMALNEDIGYVHIGVERGTRKGCLLGPVGIEVMCFWKCAQLDGQTIHIRVPNGTFNSHPLGLVQASVSSLYFLKLSEEQVAEYQDNISNPEYKRVIMHFDGFSDHWGAKPGKGIHEKFVAQCMASDVGKILYQTPSTGVASWPGKVTSLLGEMMSEVDWKERRFGDRRAYEYIKWAVENGKEGIGVISRLCSESGIECHASLRMNLFWKPDHGDLGKACDIFFNGRWWFEHPEARKPDSHTLDYAHPAARKFIIDILTELAYNYDVDGINLDFTRWPPVADPEHHDFDVLTSFIIEFRRVLDQIASKKSRRMAMSVSVTDGYHAYMNLEEQKIDLEAWLSSGCLDFICVQAFDQARHIALAKKYRVPYISINDQHGFDTDKASRDDPEWWQDDQSDEDPLPHEELEESPRINSTLDPQELDRGYLKKYREGADGVCPVNMCIWHALGRLGHIKEMEERVKTGKRWGQEPGPRIEII